MPKAVERCRGKGDSADKNNSKIGINKVRLILSLVVLYMNQMYTPVIYLSHEVESFELCQDFKFFK